MKVAMRPWPARWRSLRAVPAVSVAPFARRLPRPVRVSSPGTTRPAGQPVNLQRVCQVTATSRRAPVTDSAALEALAKRVKSECGRADILVNSAGTTRFVPHADLDALDDDLISTILGVNVRGVIAATRAFRPLLAENGQGLVVNISSIAAVTAMGSNIAYCASKAAVDNLTKSLGRALAPNIRVVSVSPGLVDTEFVRGLDETWRNQQAHRTPMKRLAMPSEVAAAVIAVALYLPFTTGTVIPVDGGRPLM